MVEADTEDLDVKRRIVAEVEALVADRTIIVGNSSHLEPEEIYRDADDAERTSVVHYFFPAERNIVVEVVPGETTAPGLTDWLLGFYEQIGKALIKVGPRYGYAIDPVFEGIFHAALLEVEKGSGTVKQVDEIARKAMGLGAGPFTAMNVTGGNTITALRLDEYHGRLDACFRTPDRLREQVAADSAWDTAGRGEPADYSDDQFEEVAVSMTGAYFGLVGEVLDAGLNNLADLDMAVGAANGFALGGGNELAMACHARITRKGLGVLAGQPEVKLGIIPGDGWSGSGLW